MAWTDVQVDRRAGRGHDHANSVPARRSIASGDTTDTLIAGLGVLLLIAAGIVGTYAALLFIVSALLLAARRPMESLRCLVRYSPLLLLPLLALASTAWSDAPERTSRAALQLLLTITAAILVSNRLSAREMIGTVFGGLFAICLIALAYVPASLGSGYLAGPFESKNPMGVTAQLLLALSFVVLADTRQPKLLRLSTFLSIPIAALLVFLSGSGGAVAGTAIFLITIPAFLLIGRVNIYIRIAVLLFTLALAGVALGFLPDVMAAIDSFRENILKKDATLTGRTYLWTFAERLIAERPMLGHGYYAFWRQGNIDAEGLWRWGGIANRSGFNFHNAFVEMQVDLGWLGSSLFVATCGGIAAMALYRLVTKPSPPLTFFLAYVIVIYVRSYTESGLIGPFSLFTLLWIASGVYAFSASQGETPYLADDKTQSRSRNHRIARRSV